MILDRIIGFAILAVIVGGILVANFGARSICIDWIAPLYYEDQPSRVMMCRTH